MKNPNFFTVCLLLIGCQISAQELSRHDEFEGFEEKFIELSLKDSITLMPSIRTVDRLYLLFDRLALKPPHRQELMKQFIKTRAGKRFQHQDFIYAASARARKNVEDALVRLLSYHASSQEDNQKQREVLEWATLLDPEAPYWDRLNRALELSDRSKVKSVFQREAAEAIVLHLLYEFEKQLLRKASSFPSESEMADLHRAVAPFVETHHLPVEILSGLVIQTQKIEQLMMLMEKGTLAWFSSSKGSPLAYLEFNQTLTKNLLRHLASPDLSESQILEARTKYLAYMSQLNEKFQDPIFAHLKSSIDQSILEARALGLPQEIRAELFRKGSEADFKGKLDLTLKYKVVTSAIEHLRQMDQSNPKAYREYVNFLVENFSEPSDQLAILKAERKLSNLEWRSIAFPVYERWVQIRQGTFQDLLELTKESDTHLQFELRAVFSIWAKGMSTLQRDSEIAMSLEMALLNAYLDIENAGGGARLPLQESSPRFQRWVLPFLAQFARGDLSAADFVGLYKQISSQSDIAFEGHEQATKLFLLRHLSAFNLKPDFLRPEHYIELYGAVAKLPNAISVSLLPTILSQGLYQLRELSRLHSESDEFLKKSANEFIRNIKSASLSLSDPLLRRQLAKSESDVIVHFMRNFGVTLDAELSHLLVNNAYLSQYRLEIVPSSSATQGGPQVKAIKRSMGERCFIYLRSMALYWND